MSLTGRRVQLMMLDAAPVAHAMVVALARWVRFSGFDMSNVASAVSETGTVTMAESRATLSTPRGQWSIDLPSPWYPVDDCRPIAAHVRARRRSTAFYAWPAVMSVDSHDVDVAAVGWADDATSTAAVVRAMALGTLVVSTRMHDGVECIVGDWRDALRLADDFEAQGRAASESALAMHAQFGLVWRAAQLMNDAGWTMQPVAAIERERARLHDATPSRVAARHHLVVGGWRS
jgi:hypothetical protein